MSGVNQSMLEALLAVKRLRATAPVDDDFPELRDRADHLVAVAIEQATRSEAKEDELRLTLTELVECAHDNSVAKGFWEGAEHNISEKLMLIVSELAEALEHQRAGNQGLPLKQGWLDASRNGKPDGFPFELADAVIRIADLCGYLGIDLNEVVTTKMKFNATRPHKHGKAF